MSTHIITYGAVFLSHVLLVIVCACLFYFVPAIRYSSIVEPVIVDVDAASFFEEYKRNPEKYVFLDVRGADAYERLHAAGSSLQPLHTLYTERYNLPKNDGEKEIVLICSGGVASGVAYSYLEHHGFRNIRRIDGGIEAWQAANLPVQGSSIIE